MVMGWAFLIICYWAIGICVIRFAYRKTGTQMETNTIKGWCVITLAWLAIVMVAAIETIRVKAATGNDVRGAL